MSARTKATVRLPRTSVEIGDLLRVVGVTMTNATEDDAWDVEARVDVVRDSLDAAWAEAEAALAEDRPGIRNGFVEMLNRTAREDAERWCASAMTDQGGWIAFGPTPAAALRALAAKLREHWRDD